MLHYEAINQSTLEILKKLMQVNALNDFYLVGGTALALQFGHRFSIDLDLFTGKDFSAQEIIEPLREELEIKVTAEYHNTLNLIINDVKVDLLSYKYPLLGTIQNIDGIRFIGLEDISPMKLSAIAQRGSKKDFYDLYFLLQRFTLEEMFNNFQKKFPGTDLFHITKSLVFFEDAENEPDPILIKKISWNAVKKEMERVVRKL
jgi:predicted nucleotidyltransferase component of viral defense system